jgi:hypothetical protein
VSAETRILGKTGNFARELGITVCTSRNDESGFYLDGYVGEHVLTTMFSTIIETNEKPPNETREKIICYYSQNHAAISAENHKMKKKLVALKEEHGKRPGYFSFNIGDVYELACQ